MEQLANRRILLGVTGGIAAYKSAEVIRRLKDQGAEVRVVMTAAGQEFITPLTLQALSGNPVATQLLDESAEAAMGHIQLARWADAIVIAPASADFIAKLTHGEGSDLLSTLCLATQAPIAIAPAMNQMMWQNTATQENLNLLAERGVTIFGTGVGSQACGETGPGRMLEADIIALKTADLFQRRLLDGKRIVITAGPTQEAIDPVRYISNHSSGKMGFALAQAASDAGAITTLIAGPVHLTTPDRVKRINVVSAEQMLSATQPLIAQCDIFIACAAVADYRPEQIADQKIKKTGSSLSIALVRNPDILATVAPQCRFAVGFAAETQDTEKYARQKLADKQLDMIIANNVSNKNIGFNSDDNAVSVFWSDGEQQFPQQSKAQLSRQLIQLIAVHEKQKYSNLK